MGCSESPTAESREALAGKSLCVTLGDSNLRWELTESEYHYVRTQNNAVAYEERGRWGKHDKDSIWIHALWRNGEEIDFLNVYDYRVVAGIQVRIGGRSYRYCEEE
mgnify:CR=1 FL=1